MKIKSLILASVLTLSQTILAESNSLSCSIKPAVIIYVNGIWNSKKEEASESARVIGDAIAIAPVKGGAPIGDDSRRFVLWKREPDGIWRISQSMSNSIRPIGSGTSRFLSRMMDRKKRS